MIMGRISSGWLWRYGYIRLNGGLLYRRGSRVLSPITYTTIDLCAMFDLPLIAFLVSLPIVCWADVQVSAPNCSVSSFAWVSYPWLDPVFVITTPLPRLHPCLVKQLAWTESMCSRGIPNGVV